MNVITEQQRCNFSCSVFRKFSLLFCIGRTENDFRKRLATSNTWKDLECCSVVERLYLQATICLQRLCMGLF